MLSKFMKTTYYILILLLCFNASCTQTNNKVIHLGGSGEVEYIIHPAPTTHRTKEYVKLVTTIEVTQNFIIINYIDAQTKKEKGLIISSNELEYLNWQK